MMYVSSSILQKEKNQFQDSFFFPSCCAHSFYCRSLCYDVWARFGEARSGCWTCWPHAGMPWCCYSICSSAGTVWQPNWTVPVYTGFLTISFKLQVLILLCLSLCHMLIEISFSCKMSLKTGENCGHVYFFTIFKVSKPENIMYIYIDR